jgi:hypothetical protein
MNDPVWRLSADLLRAGICLRRRAVLALLYDRALTENSATSWTRLYRAIFSALLTLSRDSTGPAWRSSASVELLLRIVEDDLGSQLFGAQATRRLRARLSLNRFPAQTRLRIGAA